MYSNSVGTPYTGAQFKHILCKVDIIQSITLQCLQQTAKCIKSRQMCTGINNFLHTFYSAVVQMKF